MNNEVHHQLRESEEGHPKGEALRRQVSGAGVPLGAVREGLVMGGSLNWDLNTRRTSHAEASGRRPGLSGPQWPLLLSLPSRAAFPVMVFWKQHRLILWRLVPLQGRGRVSSAGSFPPGFSLIFQITSLLW